MPHVGQTDFTWFMPDDSQHDEKFGEESRAVAALQLRNATADVRRQAAKDILEWPKYDTAGARHCIIRNLPLRYPNPFIPDQPEGLDIGFLYASQFLSGKGVGPRGQSPAVGTNVPIPVYDTYQYQTEFNYRTYDILTDAQVAGTGFIGAPTLASIVSVPRYPGAPAPDTEPQSVLPGHYYYVVTAIDSDGETLPSGEADIVIAANVYGIKLTWTAPVGGGQLGYKIYRGNASGGENVWIAVPLGKDATTYTDTFREPVPAATPPVANTTGSPIAASPDEGQALANGDGRIGSRYITRNSRQAAKGVTIPRSFFYYIDSGVGTPEGILKTTPTISVQYCWHMVPRAAVPVTAILQNLWRLNPCSFDGWPPWTLLFEGVDYRRYRSALGGRVVDVSYTFTALPNVNLQGVPMGHLSVLEYTGGDPLPGQPNRYRSGFPSKVDYSTVNCDLHGNGNFIYQFGNFANLFRPDT